MADAPDLSCPEGYAAIALRTPTIPPAEHTACYVVGREQALVVDPGSPYPREIERLLDEVLLPLRGDGGTIRAVFLTHHHPDHVGGAEAVARALDLPIAAHAATLAHLDIAASLRIERVDDEQRFAIDDGARWVAAVHTPGHASGHLSLYEPAARVLIGGDMAPGIGTTVVSPPEGDMTDYITGLERLAALSPEWVLPAHGPTYRDGQAKIEALIAHRLQREAKVLAALDARSPRPLLAVTADAYPEVPVVLHPLASRSTLAHLLKLERDGRAARGGGGGDDKASADDTTDESAESASWIAIP